MRKCINGDYHNYVMKTRRNTENSRKRTAFYKCEVCGFETMLPLNEFIYKDILDNYKDTNNTK